MCIDKSLLLVIFPIFFITPFSKINPFVTENGLEDIFCVAKNEELMAWYIGLDKFKEFAILNQYRYHHYLISNSDYMKIQYYY